ncbi:MAG: protein phosphatase CheZ [Oceanococcaceae bacterium]
MASAAQAVARQPAPDREDVLAQGLAQLATLLAAELNGLDADGRLRRAVADLPDARSRLDAVAKLTEEAAHRTLDLVEAAQIQVRELRQHEDPQVRAVAESLRGVFMELAEAQGFQDLSGQIIGRVHRILEAMQLGLVDLIVKAGIELPQDSDRSPEEELAGPAVHGLESDKSASQDDADALLKDLGL